MASTRLDGFDLLAASSLQRAEQTARVIATELGLDGVYIEPRIMERDAGAFGGLTRVQIEERFPGYLDQGRWPEGWEPDDAVVARVRAGLDALAGAVGAGGVVVAITHGGCIYALEALLGAPVERISNLGARWFQLDDGTLTLGERIHLLDPSIETTPGVL